MPKAYSMDLRKRVIEASDEGQTIDQVAKRFRVSASFVEKLQQRRRERGTLEPKPHGGGR
jgi:transposase